MADKNQTEKEFFEIEGLQRKGLESAASIMMPEIMAVAASCVKLQSDTWMKRAVLAVVNNDALKQVLATRTGIYSIIQAWSDMAIMGLQPGGAYPHFHLMPKDGKVIPVLSAEGYSFCATHSDGAVLQHEPEIIAVHENDDFKIDMSEKIVKHTFDPFSKDRGHVVGWYAELNYINGYREIPNIPQSKVLDIIKHYSRTESKSGKMPAWEKSEFEMWKKTAAKQLLKKPLMEAKGLAMLAGNYIDQEPIEEISERSIGNLAARAEEIQPQEPKNVTPAKEKNEKDIF